MRIGPSRHPEVIRNWLNQVSQMVAASCDFGLPPFGGLIDIAGPLERAKPGGSATGNDYAAIASALEASANIKKYLAGLDERYNMLRELAVGLGDFDSEVSAIRSIVGPDGAVMDSASVRLSEFRSRIQSTARQIHDVIYGYLRDSEVAKLLQNATVTLHGDRYVLPVKAEYRGRLKGVVHRESNTGATVFVEPDQSVELNNQLSDLYEDERNEVRRLLSLLAIRVSSRAV
jgi:DNA mismatch repair protein MutS2